MPAALVSALSPLRRRPGVSAPGLAAWGGGSAGLFGWRGNGDGRQALPWTKNRGAGGSGGSLDLGRTPYQYGGVCRAQA